MSNLGKRFCNWGGGRSELGPSPQAASQNMNRTKMEVTTYDGGGGEDSLLCNFIEVALCLASRTGVSGLGANCMEGRRPSFEAPASPIPANANFGLNAVSLASVSSGSVWEDIGTSFRFGTEDFGEGPSVGEGD